MNGDNQSKDNQEQPEIPGIGPTREDDSTVSYLAQLDQDTASIVEKLKSSRGYQVTFTTIDPGGSIMNHVIRNRFPNDIALKVHKECKDQLVKVLEN